MPVRLFGTVTMDDFKLDGEPNTNPTAIGSSVGIEWNVVPGEAFEGRDFTNSRYAIKDETFHVDGGLNLSCEFYFCSTYMYNRAVSAGKFTSDFQVNSNYGLKKFYDEGLGLEASVSYTHDITHGGSAFKVYAGVNLALCEIDWRKMI